MNKSRSPFWTQRGIGLVEIMVALVLGLFITAGVTSMYIQSKGSYNQDERSARMQENARYAMQLLVNDLAMADFWGGVSFGDEIVDPGATDPTQLPITQDCGQGGTRWAYQAGQAIQYFKPASTSDVPSAKFQCVTDTSSYAYKPGTNVLAIKHVAGGPTAAPVAGYVYIRTLGTGGTLMKSDGSATPAGQQDWQYQAYVYYIANNTSTGVPFLRRKHLTMNGGTPTMEDEGELAEGVDYFHIQFGIDSTGDGIPDQYFSNPTDTQLQSAISVRLYLLVRNSESDNAYTDNKTYILGDVNVNQVLNGGNPFNDRFYRRVYSTTVQLRNPQYQLLLQAGAAS